MVIKLYIFPLRLFNRNSNKHGWDKESKKAHLFEWVLFFFIVFPTRVWYGEYALRLLYYFILTPMLVSNHFSWHLSGVRILMCI